nr:hypothetical protein [Desertifilum tharense]
MDVVVERTTAPFWKSPMTNRGDRVTCADRRLNASGDSWQGWRKQH